MDILPLFVCLGTVLTPTATRQLALIAQAMLTVPGRVTMLSLSRWSDKGGSYRTIQRFFATKLAWAELLVKFFQTHLCHPQDEYILAGDETVISKAGTATFGLNRFFSGLQGQVIKGLSFFVFSLVNTRERQAYPVMVQQRVKNKAEKSAAKKPRRPKGQRGRPQGSRNQAKTELALSPELVEISDWLAVLLKLLGLFVRVTYLALDGHFGHNQAVLMARAHGLHLISKLRRDAALYEKYEGEYSGRGAPKKYGNRLRYDLMPAKYLHQSEREGETITNYYQGVFLHREFGCELNVVVIVKLNLSTRKMGHALLFSSDVALGWEKLVDYYSLRFQIEFNFRAAKQHFGLEDFMNTTAVGVENAANLSFLMVNVSAHLGAQSGGQREGINDLKSRFRGLKYAVETIKIVLEKAEGIIIAEVLEQVKEQVSQLGRIHPAKGAAATA